MKFFILLFVRFYFHKDNRFLLINHLNEDFVLYGSPIYNRYRYKWPFLRKIQNCVKKYCEKFAGVKIIPTFASAIRK